MLSQCLSALSVCMCVVNKHVGSETVKCGECENLEKVIHVFKYSAKKGKKISAPKQALNFFWH